MSHFLSRLVARSMGAMPRLEPMIAPRFAPDLELQEAPEGAGTDLVSADWTSSDPPARSQAAPLAQRSHDPHQDASATTESRGPQNRWAPTHADSSISMALADHPADASEVSKAPARADRLDAARPSGRTGELNLAAKHRELPALSIGEPAIERSAGPQPTRWPAVDVDQPLYESQPLRRDNHIPGVSQSASTEPPTIQQVFSAGGARTAHAGPQDAPPRLDVARREVDGSALAVPVSTEDLPQSMPPGKRSPADVVRAQSAARPALSGFLPGDVVGSTAAADWAEERMPTRDSLHDGSRSQVLRGDGASAPADLRAHASSWQPSSDQGTGSAAEPATRHLPRVEVVSKAEHSTAVAADRVVRSETHHAGPGRSTRSSDRTNSSSEQPSAAGSDSIHIHIGQVVVRAQAPAPERPRVRSNPTPRLSLADYLKQHRGGGE